MALCAGVPSEVVEVTVIGGEDEVEFFKVAGDDLAGGALSGDAARFEGLTHPRVGTFSFVVIDGSGGINDQLIGAASFGREVPEGVFGGGGAADISETDEENRTRSGLHDDDIGENHGHAVNSLFAPSFAFYVRGGFISGRTEDRSSGSG